jgi:hypothetical protein
VADALASRAGERAGGERRQHVLEGGGEVHGMGLGSTVMPAVSAAYQTLQRATVARVTTALNIIMRTGASIGTALLVVVLQHQLTSEPGSDAAVSANMADTCGHTLVERRADRRGDRRRAAAAAPSASRAEPARARGQ